MTLILVVDDHSVFRNGFRLVIEAGIPQACVVEANDVAAVFRYFEASQYFDLILIDSKSLSYHSLDFLREAHEQSPTTRFAVMSTSNTRADVLTCLSAGFHGFVNKFQSADEIVAAIRDLLSGRIYVPRWLADGDDGGPEIPSWGKIQADILRLTRRQNEVLSLLAQGMSNKEIAHALNISEGTTKIHTAGLLRAIGARNRTEAAFKAANLLESRSRSAAQLNTKGDTTMKGLGGTSV